MRESVANLATTWQTGYYRLGPLAPGEYAIRFAPLPPSNLAPLYYDGATDRNAALTLTVGRADVLRNIDISLSPAPDDPDDPDNPTDGDTQFLPIITR